MATRIAAVSESVSEADVSFAQWYRDVRPTIARALALTLDDIDLAGEAVDEAMTRAYQSWSKVREYDNLNGWIYRVALNWALSSFRRQRPARRAHHVIPVDMPTPQDATIMQALAALDVNQRSVVVCRYLLGWSELETADALQIPPGTVKSRLSRAAVHLRHQLAHLRPESSL
jgi:RNA polymerase sigma factor (sigma-70 family)